METDKVNKEKNTENMPAAVEDELDFLPEIHKKTLELHYGLKDGKKMSPEEIAEQIGITVETVRDLETEALRMVGQPRRTVPKEDANMIFFDHKNYRCAEGLAEKGYKAVFGEVLYCVKDKDLFAFLLIKDRAGIENIYKIKFAEEAGSLFPRFKWETILAHREGLLIGLECTWTYIRELALGKYKDEEIRSLLAAQYQDADYVKIDPISRMYHTFAHKLFGSEKRPVDIRGDEKKKILEMALKIVRCFKEIGKVVIADIHTCGFTECTLNEYEYLGSEMEEVVLKNPHLLEAQISDPDLRDFQKEEEKFFSSCY